MFFFVWFFIPETKGISLEAMDRLFGVTDGSEKVLVEEGHDEEGNNDNKNNSGSGGSATGQDTTKKTGEKGQTSQIESVA